MEQRKNDILNSRFTRNTCLLPPPPSRPPTRCQPHHYSGAPYFPAPHPPQNLHIRFSPYQFKFGY